MFNLIWFYILIVTSAAMVVEAVAEGSPYAAGLAVLCAGASLPILVSYAIKKQREN